MAKMQRQNIQFGSKNKIFSLDQKIKLPKTCEKRSYKRIKVVLEKKRLLKQVIFDK